MLKQRILTALVLAPLIIWALFGLPDNLLMVLFAAILLGGVWEWTTLAELQNHMVKIAYLLLQLAMMWLAWWLLVSFSASVPIILISVVLAWFIILFWLAMYERGNFTIQLAKISRALLGILLLPVTLLSIAFILVSFENDRLYIFLMFLLIWGADSAAYFSGRAFGKNKLAPSISPGKTWEGVAGALLMTIVISTAAWWFSNYSAALLPKLIVFSLLVVSLSIVGDLFESLLKRQVGVKDSSNLLPGHGGVLDRIDSLIAASPVYALGLYLLGAA